MEASSNEQENAIALGPLLAGDQEAVLRLRQDGLQATVQLLTTHDARERDCYGGWGAGAGERKNT